MKLTLPLPPNIANGRMHWRVKLNAKKAYFATLDGWMLVGRFPPTPEPLPERTRIAVTLHLYSPMDDDNAASRTKWTLDWLVKRRFLRGDSRKYLEWAGLPKQVIDRKNQRVEVTLTPLTGGVE